MKTSGKYTGGKRLVGWYLFSDDGFYGLPLDCRCLGICEHEPYLIGPSENRVEERVRWWKSNYCLTPFIDCFMLFCAGARDIVLELVRYLGSLTEDVQIW